MGHCAAGDADDELEYKGGDGVARVARQDIGQRQADGTGQTAGDAVQQQGGEGGEGVAQMERRAAVEGHPEEQVGHKAQRRHDARECQLMDGEGALIQHTAENDQNDNDCQQQPHCGGRHEIPSYFNEIPEIPTKLIDFFVLNGYAPIIPRTDLMKIPRTKIFYGVSLALCAKRGGRSCSI